jgi:hypothetical protein
MVQPCGQSFEILQDGGCDIRGEFVVVHFDDGGIGRGRQALDLLQQALAGNGVHAAEQVQVDRPSARQLVGSKRLWLGLQDEPLQLVLAIEAHSGAASDIIFAHEMRSREGTRPVWARDTEVHAPPLPAEAGAVRTWRYAGLRDTPRQPRTRLAPRKRGWRHVSLRATSTFTPRTRPVCPVGQGCMPRAGL